MAKRKPFKLFPLTKKTKKLGVKCLIALIIIFGLFLIGLIIFAEQKLSLLVLGGRGEVFSTEIYSKPTTIQKFSNVRPEEILIRLERLNYHASKEVPLVKGEYIWQMPILKIFSRGFSIPTKSQDPGVVMITFSATDIRSIQCDEGLDLYEFDLEPELIKEISGTRTKPRFPDFKTSSKSLR